jgi:hypothetical protein
MITRSLITRFDESWGDDWRQRLEAALRSAGYEDVKDYMSRYPADTYFALAERLGEGIAPYQFLISQAEMATTPNEMRRVCADCLSRKMRQHLPSGWNTGEQIEFRTVRVYCEWLELIDLIDAQWRPAAKAIWQSLRERAQTGWLPGSEDDPLIQELFRTYWRHTDA